MKIFQSVYFWIAVVLILYYAWDFLNAYKKQRSQFRNFNDLVKNPSLWKVFEEQRNLATEAKAAAQEWDAQQIGATVQHYLFDITSKRDAYIETQVLKSLGSKTHAKVLEILVQQDLYAQLVAPTGEDILPEAPLNRACDLLDVDDEPPPEAVDALIPFLSDPTAEIRKSAILSIAKTGCDKIIPHVLKAFEDEDEYVRSYALMGLEFSLGRNALSSATKQALMPGLMQLLNRNHNAREAASVLIRVNRPAAIDYFNSPDVFRADAPIVHIALETLANFQERIPRERLLLLISELELKEFKYPQTDALKAAFRLLGQHHVTEDESLFQKYITHKDSDVCEGASDGLLCLNYLDGYQERLYKRTSEVEYAHLSKPERLVYALLELDSEVRNGGFSQYFVNSSGNHSHDALEAVEAMGFKDRLDLMRQVFDLFGPVGPEADREKRQDQFSKIFEEHESSFEGFDLGYYHIEEDINVHLAKYVIANKAHFKQSKS